MARYSLVSDDAIVNLLDICFKPAENFILLCCQLKRDFIELKLSKFENGRFAWKIFLSPPRYFIPFHFSFRNVLIVNFYIALSEFSRAFISLLNDEIKTLYISLDKIAIRESTNYVFRVVPRRASYNEAGIFFVHQFTLGIKHYYTETTRKKLGQAGAGQVKLGRTRHYCRLGNVLSSPCISEMPNEIVESMRSGACVRMRVIDELLGL